MLVDCLGEIIREKCRETPHDGVVTLRDQHQEAKVSDLAGNAVVIRLDQCIGELSGGADGAGGEGARQDGRDADAAGKGAGGGSAGQRERRE